MEVSRKPSAISRCAGQRSLFDLHDDTNRDAAQQGRAPKSTKSFGRPKAAAKHEVSEHAQVEIAGRLDRLESRLAAIEAILARLVETAASQQSTKDYYTTEEVAERLGKRPYTVREWCRLGRVHAEKAHSGRGADEEWRISQAELTRIQNEGLLSAQRESRLVAPRRLPK